MHCNKFRRYLKNHLFGMWEITAQCGAWFSALYKYSYLLTYLLNKLTNFYRYLGRTYPLNKPDGKLSLRNLTSGYMRTSTCLRLISWLDRNEGPVSVVFFATDLLVCRATGDRHGRCERRQGSAESPRSLSPPLPGRPTPNQPPCP